MKPILFNTEMVKAILDGRKTVTRRPIKPQPTYPFAGWITSSTDNLRVGNALFHKDCDSNCEYHKPQYKIGDILYVRETFAVGKIDSGDSSDGHDEGCYISQCLNETDIIPKEYAERHNIYTEEVKWTPSIHMKKKDARIVLKVTDVRVERVQDINGQGHHDDVLKEGITVQLSEVDCGYTPSHKFRDIWQNLYGDWDANPWVWVYEFEVVPEVQNI